MRVQTKGQKEQFGKWDSPTNATRTMEAQEALIALLQKLQDSLGHSKHNGDDVALPIFDPSKADLGAAVWCGEIEQLGHELGWSGRETVARAGKVLKGTAVAWFENWEPTQRDWETFKADIVDIFPPKRNLAEKLKAAVLLSSETFDTYCQSVTRRDMSRPVLPSKPETSRTCGYCHKSGHLIENCWAKQRADKDEKPRVNTLQKQPLVRNDNNLTLVMIRGKPVHCLIDTGAECSLMTEKTALQVGSPLKPCATRLKGIGSTFVTAFASTEVLVETEEVSLELRMFVVRNCDLSYEAILGRNAVQYDDIGIVTDKTGARLVRMNALSKPKQVNVVSTGWIPPAISNLNGVEQARFSSLMSRFQNMITSGNAVNKIQTAELRIVLKSDKVISYHPYRLSLAERQKIREMVSDLLSNKIIQESESPYASPVLLVKKKDGSDRLCVDFRALNRITVKDRFPLPLIEDQLDRLGKGTYFTALDMASGFYQIPIAADSVAKTGFVTPDGHYEYLRMPFGLANAPAVFQRAINNALGPLKDRVALVYLDDVLIPSTTIERGIEKLELVLTALAKAGFSLNINKCKFFQTTVDYLGRSVSAEGIRPSTGKVTALANSPTPGNVKQVRQFMGLASYFRKFIPEFASRTASITQLTKKSTPFSWNKEHEEAKRYVIQHLSAQPLLSIFDASLPTEVHTDASSIGYGAILFQKPTPDSALRVVAYFSRRTTPAESSYHSYELETLAIVNALKHFRVYLIGIPFKIVTDCNAIKATVHKRDLIPRVARWWIYLQDFDFEVEYRKGKHVAHVDYLSRNPPNTVLADRETKSIIAKINAGDPVVSDFEVKHSILYRKLRMDDGSFTFRYFVPKGSRLGLLRLYHDEQCHVGGEKTLHKVREQFWFPRMTSFVKKYIAHCLVCVTTKRPSGPKQGLLHSIDKTPTPFHTVHADCLGPFKVTTEGFKHTLLLIDAFTKYVLLIPLRTLTGSEMVSALETHLLLFGTPARMISDRGTNFTDKKVRDLLNGLKIEHHLIATAAPRANGQVERYVATVITLLAVEIQKVSEWTSVVPKVQLTLNSTVQKTTGFTPLHLLIGADTNVPQVQSLVDSVPQNVIKIDLRQDRDLAYERLRVNARTQKERFDKARRDNKTFAVGTFVFLQQQNPRMGKLDPKFKGPFEITALLPGDRFEIKCRSTGRHQVAPKDRLRRWPGEFSDDFSDNTSDDDPEFLADAPRERAAGQEGRVDVATAEAGPVVEPDLWTRRWPRVGADRRLEFPPAPRASE
ncbi:hypothetical protein GEV33_002293 [Tenebrio molitor]|uniref:RNA-directed DNA polymerase n=1 Tax=Tenebrio molitor TaxID=7067 RepID=A0A8J6HUP1_TENMO|nr:hypothetical protein GEV33_002293 [Tenebrio molitor]